MSDAPKAQIHPAVLQLLAQAELQAGRILFGAATLQSFRSAFERLPVDECRQVGSHLVATALRWRREGGQAAETGVAQLLELADITLKKSKRADKGDGFKRSESTKRNAAPLRAPRLGEAPLRPDLPSLKASSLIQANRPRITR
jgi:hypothetical protein